MSDERVASSTTLVGSGGIGRGLHGVETLEQPVTLSKQSIVGSSHFGPIQLMFLSLPLQQSKKCTVRRLR